MSEKNTIEKVRMDSLNLYGDKYTLPEQYYKNNRTDLKIFCTECGEIFHKDYDHFINRKQGCPLCFKKKKITINKVQKKSLELFGEKYFIKDQIIRDVLSKIDIFCNDCQDNFSQTIHNHMKGEGCQKCGGNKRLTIQDMISKSKDINGDRYIIPEQEFINCETKVKIFCKQCDDYFLQDYDHHIYRKQGCPNHPIKFYSKGELIISDLLDNKNIRYKRQFKFDKCKNIKELPFDFYLPEYNTCIEFNGEQHYKPVIIFGGQKKYDKIIITDEIKKEFCRKNNINLLVIKHNENIKNKIEELWT